MYMGYYSIVVWLDPCRIPAIRCLHPSANVLVNVLCVCRNSALRFAVPTALESKTF